MVRFWRSGKIEKQIILGKREEMKFNIQNLSETYKMGFRELIKELDQEITTDRGIPVVVRESDENKVIVTYEEDTLVLTGKKKVQIFRGLARFLQEGSACRQIEETSVFETNGVMIDCSRNGVMNLKELKSQIRMMASMGIEKIWLYMEDTYTIEGEPYFGAFRGRYTKEELREADEYAALFGIEIVPCIQTLAHLRAFLKWPQNKEICDVDDILFVGEERVKGLIRKMIEQVMEPFRTKQIHLGMDEAFQLGRGKYLRKHGYREVFEIMSEHLGEVCGVCKDLGYSPIIWSDMFIRPITPDGDYYGIKEGQKPPETECVPKEIGLVYWDYYNHEKEIYKRCLEFHKKLTENVIFATGGWTWNGVAPNYEKALDTMKKGVEVASDLGIKQIFCTLWYDNGAETPMQTSLFPILYFAQLCYGASVNEIELNKWLAMYSGFSASDYMLLNSFDAVPGTVLYNANGDNPSKYLLYQDVLLGLFDKQIEGLGMTQYYEILTKKLDEAISHASFGKKMSQMQQENKGYRRYAANSLFGYYRTLASVLSKKAELGIRAYQAYHAGNKRELFKICEVLSECREQCLKLKDQREALWFMECKPNGFEVMDIRLGGLITRLESAQKRIRGFLMEKWDTLPELEEKRLLYQPVQENDMHKLCSCNLWENIVSAGNIDGV